jgi:hypothetical protein
MQMSNATFDSRQESFTTSKWTLDFYVVETSFAAMTRIKPLVRCFSIFDQANSNDTTAMDLATNIFRDVWMRMDSKGLPNINLFESFVGYLCRLGWPER